MKWVLSHPLALFALGIAFALIPLTLGFFFDKTSERLRQAQANYDKGEKSVDATERQVAFNRALSLYTDLEKNKNPRYGNGKLYYNIGNVYYQLGEYPRAILYYYKALSLRPEDARGKENLLLALDKMNLSLGSSKTGFSRAVANALTISLPRRLQLLFVFTLFAIAAGSFFLWRPTRLSLSIAIVCAVLTFTLCGSVLYSRYVSPLEGVVLRSSFLYKGAGEQYARAREKPLAAGEKVEVLDLGEKEKWIKILSPEGELGYISQDDFQLIF